MLTRDFADFIIGTKTSQIPEEALLRARDGLGDTLGVALAGTLEPVGKIAIKWIEDTASKPQATVLGTNKSCSAEDAAFINGIFAHALDFDDSLPTLRGHPSAPVVAAALAAGEAVGASGKEVLAAYVMGLEVAGKLGRVMGNGHYLRGWHTTSTVGTFTATAVAARLWSLTTEQLQTAWGLAASQVSGLVRNFGTMTKPFHVGRAARCGVMSARLVKNGFTADQAIFEKKNSIFDTYAGDDGIPLSDLMGQLGSPWEVITPANWVKRWPCCYSGHRAIGGVFELLKKHQINVNEIQEIAIGFLPGTDTPLISTNPQTGLEGKFSVEYAVAAAAIDGKLTLESFTDAMVQRAPVRNIMAKVRRYRIEDKKVYGLDAYTDVEIATAQGRYKMHVEHTPGSPAWPMTIEDREEKFMGCAVRVFGAKEARKLLTAIDASLTLNDIRGLTKLTRANQ